jgi:hypothetical protein
MGKVPKVGPLYIKQHTYRIVCHEKFGQKYSIYDMKLGAHTFGIFSPFVVEQNSTK